MFPKGRLRKTVSGQSLPTINRPSLCSYITFTYLFLKIFEIVGQTSSSIIRLSNKVSGTLFRKWRPMPVMAWGLFPMGGSTVRLHRQIPYTWAMELLLTGDHYSAADAFRMGLIGRVVPNGHALSVAQEIAERVAANGPVAVRNIKRSVQDTEFLPEEEALAIELKLGSEVFATEDAREGPKAFKEKRTPQFKGR